ncbi:MAG: VWA domain-containing protein [Planctomycetota bacterium]
MTPLGIDQLGWPWALAALAAVPVLAAIMIARAARGGTATPMNFSGQRFLETGPRGIRASLAFLPGVLRLAALVAVVFAVARPQSIQGETRTRTDGIAIQLVVDRSGSMNEEIEYEGALTTRLDAVKRVAASFIEGDGEDLSGRQGDLIGLVAFARYADTICPLVQEHQTLLELLAGVETARIQTEDGTAIGEAVALAAGRLRNAELEVKRAAEALERRAIASGAATTDADDTGNDTGNDTGTDTGTDTGNAEAQPEFTIASKAIVLLTDGQNNRGDIDPIQAATLAQEWGIRIYAIGIGGGSRQMRLGGLSLPIGSTVDTRMLSQIADMTGGRFWLASDAETLREIYAQIDELETTQIETTRSTNVEERFAPFAIAALALLVTEIGLSTLLFRRVP